MAELVSQPGCLSFSAQYLLVATVSWDSVLGPTSLTQAPVGLLRLSRTLGSVYPVCPSLPVLTSLCPSFLGWEGEGRGHSVRLSTFVLSAPCSCLTPQAVLFSRIWVLISPYLGRAGGSVLEQWLQHSVRAMNLGSEGLQAGR